MQNVMENEHHFSSHQDNKSVPFYTGNEIGLPIEENVWSNNRLQFGEF